MFASWVHDVNSYAQEDGASEADETKAGAVSPEGSAGVTTTARCPGNGWRDNFQKFVIPSVVDGWVQVSFGKQICKIVRW